MTLGWTQRLGVEGTFLRSRLGRRIFLMFCIAALVPAIAVFVLTYRAAARDAHEAARASLRAESKFFGMEVYQRLQTAQMMLEGYRPDSGSAISSSLLTAYFADVVALDAGVSSRGESDLARRIDREAVGELQGPDLVVLPEHGGMPPEVVLLNRYVDGNRPRLIAGKLKSSFLWGDPTENAVEGRSCVSAGNQTLFCRGESPETGSGGSEVQDDWELFLNARFGGGSWAFDAARPSERLLTSHVYVLAPLVASLLLLVLLLSSIEIRRILLPLEALMARINAIGTGARVASRRGDEDEIGALAGTFDEMERRIGRQMETLNTLANIDRMILDRADLTVVVPLVISRVRELVEVSAVGVTMRRNAHGGGMNHFVWAGHEERPESGDSPLLAPVRLQEYAIHSTVGHWITSENVGPGFMQHGVRQALMLPLGVRDGASGWLALGVVPGQAFDSRTLDEVRELGERIAVALAVEEHEGMLVFQARHDALTGLANRLAAVEELAVAVERSRTSQREFAVVFIDLDRFKSINDGLGHALGDAILVDAAERIRTSLGVRDFVARFGGDEFFVILREASSAAEAARATARIMAAFEEPIVVEGIELVVGFSAGVAMHPHHGTDAHQLIHNSDVAMYRAKRSGGGRMEFFEEEMNEAALTRMQLESDLRAAIRNDQLHLHYQPRIDSRSGRMVGAEALVRWTHPTRGAIAPTTFISVAEQTGLIDELGAFVLNQACQQLAAWKRAGLSLPLVAVNVSSHQLRSGRLPGLMATAVATAGIEWRELEIEVTESLLVHDTGSAAQQLQEIRDAGATVAIDDFGTGYSSLAYLTLLPIDTLKIDRAFMANLDGTEAPTAIIRSIIALALALGKNLVAEGVESMDHVEMLHGWGCDIIQGYVFHRPLEPAALAEALVERSGALSSPSAA